MGHASRARPTLIRSHRICGAVELRIPLRGCQSRSGGTSRYRVRFAARRRYSRQVPRRHTPGRPSRPLHSDRSGLCSSPGHAAALPVHVSRRSQLLIARLHTVPPVANASAGHAAALPVQCSATSHEPAAARQVVALPAKLSAGQAAELRCSARQRRTPPLPAAHDAGGAAARRSHRRRRRPRRCMPGNRSDRRRRRTRCRSTRRRCRTRSRTARPPCRRYRCRCRSGGANT